MTIVKMAHAHLDQGRFQVKTNDKLAQQGKYPIKRMKPKADYPCAVS
jgi:phage antirepressor YoqD-like protein